MAESRERVYILSQDYWGFDPSSKNDTLNFYDNVWTLKKNQYDGLSDEVRNQLYRCALFYHKSRVDNHGYTPLAIRDEGTTVKVRGPNRQGLVEMRTYISGGQSPPYVVTDGTDTITMRAADPAASDMTQLETVGGNTTPGTFTIKQFIYEEKDILDTINKLESEIGDVINLKAAEFVSPTDVLPVPSAYEESRPMAENPQSQGFSAEFTQKGLGRSGVSGYVTWDGEIMRCMRCNAAARQAYGPKSDPYFSCGDGGCQGVSFRKGNALEVRAEGEAAPEMTPASVALMVSDPYSANPPAALYSDVDVQYDPSGVEGGYTPQDTFIAAEGDRGAKEQKTHKMGPKSATLSHRLSAKARMKARNAARASKQSDNYGAEEAVPLNQEVPMGDEMRQVMTTQAFGQAGGDYDHMIHYSSETPGSDDNFVMMPDAGVDILAPANAYGTNSAIVSGQGVPQWYGSAEGSMSDEEVISILKDEMTMGMGIYEKYDVADVRTAMSLVNQRPSLKAWAQKTYSSETEVNPMYFEQVGGEDALGVGLPVISNDFGEDSAGGIGRGVPQMYGAEHSGCSNCGCVLDSQSHKNDTSGSEGGSGAGMGDICDSCFSSKPEYSAEVNELVYSDDVGATNVQGVPLINNSWGNDSSIGFGRGVPQWYGSAESSGYPRNYIYNRDNQLEEEILELQEEQKYTEDSVSPGNRTTEDWDLLHRMEEKIRDLKEEREGLNKIHLGAEAPTSVAVDESSPDTYTPYEFVDGMSPDGEYMTGDDFMTLLSETIDGMGSRYQKPTMFKSPIAMTVGGGIIAAVGYMLYKR